MHALLALALMAQAGTFYQNNSGFPAIYAGNRTAVADVAYSQVATDYEIAYTSITASRTVTLLSPASLKVGQTVLVKDESGSVTASIVILLSPAAGNIDGAASATIATAYGSALLVSDGTNYHVIGGTSFPSAGFTDTLGTTATILAVRASNASQTTETAIAATQSGTTAGYTGKFVSVTCSSTTGTGSCLAVDAVNTTAGNGLLVNANSATTTTATAAKISATAMTTGTTLLVIGGSEANVTSAGRYLSVQDSAGKEMFSVGADTHQVFAQTTLPVVTNTGGSGPSCAGCTDSNGKIVATTAANANVITLTFNTSATPRGCVITPADANTAVDLKAAGGGVVAVAAGSFTVSAPTGNWAANQKNIYYSCFF